VSGLGKGDGKEQNKYLSRTGVVCSDSGLGKGGGLGKGDGKEQSKYLSRSGVVCM